MSKKGIDNLKDLLDSISKDKQGNSNRNLTGQVPDGVLEDIFQDLNFSNIDEMYDTLMKVQSELEVLDEEMNESKHDSLDDLAILYLSSPVVEPTTWEEFKDTVDEVNVEVPDEFFDITRVMELGAKKYGVDSYLLSNNISMKHKNNTASMFRHLAEHHMGVDMDHESGMDPLLHLACRALMAYTRKQRGIKEDE